MSTNQFPVVIDKNFITTVQLCLAVERRHGKELFKKLLDKDYDINYKIPDSYSIFHTNRGGQTIFQLAHSESVTSQLLIELGVDYLVADENGSTTLLEKPIMYEHSSYLNFPMESPDSKDSYMNVITCILSAQLSSRNATNPKNIYGFSHFHVACMYNQVDVVKFFLDNGVSINETINSDSKFYPGYSALHFAAKACSYETVDLLIMSGANMFAKDSKGRNPLHVLIHNRRKICITLGTMRSKETLGASYYSSLCSYYNKLDTVIYLLMKKMDDKYIYLDYNTGLSYIHVLCLMGGTLNLPVVKHCLDNERRSLTRPVDMDSKFWPGYTPLHFAAHSDVETVELLVKEGADLCTKDANGVTPFEICLKEFTVANVHKILLLIPNYSSILFSDNKTKLSDFIYAMERPDTFKDFLKSNVTDINMFIPFDSPICAGYTPLHLTIMCTERPMNFNSKTYNYARLLPKRASQKYLSIINICLKFNPDVTIRDARGSTPLHWAFRLQQIRVVPRLLEQYKTNSNFVDEYGLSHLHIACAAKNVKVVKKLIFGGANVNEVATLSYTWMNAATSEDEVESCFITKLSTPLHFASTVESFEVVKLLVENGANVLAQNIDDMNPLEIILKVSIFKDSARPNPKDAAFDVLPKEIIETLVRKIGDELPETKSKQMLHCFNVLENDILSTILSHADESAMKILASVGITPLHVACYTRNLLQVNKLTETINVNASVNLESPLWPGCTPLHIFTMDQWENVLDDRPAYMAIMDKLLKNGADVAALNAKGETPIHQSFYLAENYSRTLLEHLKDFSINPMSKKGLTHLHCASAYSTPSIVEELLKQGAVINQPTDYFLAHYGGFTALQIAVSCRKEKIVDVLLKHGADINWRNAYGGNVLHTAMGLAFEPARRPCLELLRTLIGAGADIHAKNMFGERPFDTLIKSNNRTKEEIELFLENGCHVNVFDPVTDVGLLAVAFNQHQQSSVFQIICKASDVRKLDDKGRNAIHNLVSFKRTDWFHYGGAEQRRTKSDENIKTIRSLIDLGLNINQQDSQGLTPLHKAAKMQNLCGVIGLLKNGADINIGDADGKVAFAYSLELTRLDKEIEQPDHLLHGYLQLESAERISILKLISLHVLKLSLASAKISMSNREVAIVIREKYPLDTSKVEACSTEIDKMKDSVMNSTLVTFYDFLSDTGAVGVYPYMLLNNKKAIDDLFKNNIESVRKKFPEFTGILLLQYGKALARCEIIDSAANSLNDLLGGNMPGICLKLILRFLDNDELINLVNSTSV